MLYFYHNYTLSNLKRCKKTTKILKILKGGIQASKATYYPRKPWMQGQFTTTYSLHRPPPGAQTKEGKEQKIQDSLLPWKCWHEHQNQLHSYAAQILASSQAPPSNVAKPNATETETVNTHTNVDCCQRR